MQSLNSDTANAVPNREDAPFSLAQPAPDIIHNRKYFVLHYPTARMREVLANTAERACEIAGWWFDDCFVHFLRPEVGYSVHTGKYPK